MKERKISRNEMYTIDKLRALEMRFRRVFRMKIFKEIWKVGEVWRRFPQGFVWVVVEAVPFDELVMFSPTKFWVEDLIDFPFQLVLNDYWFGTRMSFARVWTLGWLEKRNMEYWMKFPQRREFELVSRVGYNWVDFEWSKLLFGKYGRRLSCLDVWRTEPNLVS